MKNPFAKVFRPGRDVRLKTTILLPDGNRIALNVNVSEKLREMVIAQTKAMQAADAWVKDPDNDELKDVFYERFSESLTVIMGKRNFDEALIAYDLDRVELCRRFDKWASEEVVPLVRQASALEVEKRKRAYQRMSHA